VYRLYGILLQPVSVYNPLGRKKVIYLLLFPLSLLTMETSTRKIIKVSFQNGTLWWELLQAVYLQTKSYIILGKLA